MSVACYLLPFTFSEILFIWFNPYDSRFFFCSSCTASNGKGNIMFLVNDALRLCFHVVVFIAPCLLEFLYMCLFYETFLIYLCYEEKDLKGYQPDKFNLKRCLHAISFLILISSSFFFLFFSFFFFFCLG